jgi:hypothetical protein
MNYVLQDERVYQVFQNPHETRVNIIEGRLAGRLEKTLNLRITFI